MTASNSLGPNYRRLWSSSAVSNLADGVFVVALPLIAVQLTDSPMLVAGVSVAGRLPSKKQSASWPEAATLPFLLYGKSIRITMVICIDCPNIPSP